MRLVQFRFDERHRLVAHEIGQKIQGIFWAELDQKIKVVSSTREGGPQYLLRGLDAVDHIASEAFENSFRSTTHYGSVFALKSINSCRFVFFDADGLVRVCLSNDDDVQFFSSLGVQIEDVSDLLVSTDIFDYL